MRLQNLSILDNLEGEELVSRTIKYPIILMITAMPISILRLIQALNGSLNLFIFEVISLLLFSLQGMANSVAYGWNESIRGFLLEKCLKKKFRHDSKYIKMKSLSI
jgi:hypothetical protein